MSNNEVTKAEQIIMDYTASTKWEDIEKIHWTTSEVMDVFDTYFKNPLERSDNSDYAKSLCESCGQPCKENDVATCPDYREKYREVFVMQCSTIKDKKGTKIYAGDIVTFYHHGEPDHHQPIGTENNFNPLCFGVVKFEKGMFFIDDGLQCPYLSKVFIDEIKGNRYQNPEILIEKGWGESAKEEVDPYNGDIIQGFELETEE